MEKQMESKKRILLSKMKSIAWLTRHLEVSSHPKQNVNEISRITLLLIITRSEWT